MTAPERAHSIILKAGGDSPEDLAHELESLARSIRTGHLTVGCGGGPSSSSIYWCRANPEQTHDAYFREVDTWLAGLEAA